MQQREQAGLLPAGCCTHMYAACCVPTKQRLDAGRWTLGPPARCIRQPPAASRRPSSLCPLCPLCPLCLCLSPSRCFWPGGWAVGRGGSWASSLAELVPERAPGRQGVRCNVRITRARSRKAPGRTSERGQAARARRPQRSSRPSRPSSSRPPSSVSASQNSELDRRFCARTRSSSSSCCCFRLLVLHLAPCTLLVSACLHQTPPPLRALPLSHPHPVSAAQTASLSRPRTPPIAGPSVLTPRLRALVAPASPLPWFASGALLFCSLSPLRICNGIKGSILRPAPSPLGWLCLPVLLGPALPCPRPRACPLTIRSSSENTSWSWSAAVVWESRA